MSTHTAIITHPGMPGGIPLGVVAYSRVVAIAKLFKLFKGEQVLSLTNTIL